jgi:hypothetical protein
VVERKYGISTECTDRAKAEAKTALAAARAEEVAK